MSGIAAHATLEEKTAVMDAFLRLESRNVKVANYRQLREVLGLEDVMSVNRLTITTGSLIHARLLRISRGNDEPMRNSYEQRPFEFWLPAKVPAISS